MNATRWPEVERLYHAALERPAGERAVFLIEACAGDDDLRREVESLLAYRAKAADFIEEPAASADPVSSAVSQAVRKLHDKSGLGRLAGRVLGVYEVKTLIAVGGMGEVYRAVDSRLNRTVAIKTLPTELANDWERRERFKREANVISSLNHPHICTLYDVGTENDILYLVMEYIDGETLERRLERGPLPLARALEYATQICDALDKAHRSGVVHRDLKPANVMLTKSGVKLLDFGIATRPAAGVAIDSRETVGPSVERLTAQGTILGTLQYLAPEQLEGKSVDARTDIFALGALVYEMLTGKRAFQAESQAALIGRILRDDPRPIADLSPSVPAELVSSLSRCLSKDPDDRWQSASDLLFQLRSIATGLPLVESDASHPRHRSRWIERGAWAAIVVASIVATFLWAGKRDRVGIGTRLSSDGSVKASGGPVRFSIAPPAGTAFGAGPWSAGEGINVETTQIALSPDSSHLAFVATEPSRGTRIWLRPLSALDSKPVPDTEGATSVFWSPDGRSIGFFAGGKLKRLDLSGGRSGVMLSDVPGRFGMFGTWGEGSILFAPPNGPIFRVSTGGGTPMAEADLAKDEKLSSWPWFLPDGRRFLYLVRFPDRSGHVMLVDPGKPPIPVVSAISNAQWVDPDYVVFAREGTIVGQRFDTSSGRVSGEPFSIAGPVQYSRSTARATMAVSRTGSIVYQSHTDLAQLLWFDRSGKELGAVGSRADYLGIRISPDGRRVLSARAEPLLGSYDVWALDLTRNIETRLTSDPGSELAGVWLPDGASVIFTAELGGVGGLHLVRKDLTTGAETALLPGDGTMQLPDDILPDRRLLVFRQRRTGDGDSAAFTIPIDGGGAPSQLVSSRFHEGNFLFSPNGRLIALTSDESGRSELYIAPFPAMSPKTRVSTGGASQARWSRHTHELLYLSWDGHIVSVPVRTAPSLDVGAPATLFTTGGRWPWTDFDVTPDGKRFLAVVPQLSANEQPLTVILNWPSTIGRSSQ